MAVTCPKCLGSGEPMTSKKEGVGLEYKTCDLCEGEGNVSQIIEEDFILSLNEDAINNDFEGL